MDVDWKETRVWLLLEEGFGFGLRFVSQRETEILDGLSVCLGLRFVMCDVCIEHRMMMMMFLF